MIPIPIRDTAPRYRQPVIAPVLIISNIVIYFLQFTLLREHFDLLVGDLAVRSDRFLDLWNAAVDDPGFVSSNFGEFFVGGISSTLTYMFLHAGPMHLLGNMIFLWVYADNVEGRFGHWPFLLFYLTCGVCAAILHCLMDPGNTRPVVGASGAIAGVLGAYLLLFPRARVTVLVFLFVFITFFELPAWALLIYWFAIQLPQVQGVFNFLAVEGVAYWAHIGGFLAGMALTPLLASLVPIPAEAKKKRA